MSRIARLEMIAPSRVHLQTTSIHRLQIPEFRDIVTTLKSLFKLQEKTKVMVPSPNHGDGDPEIIEYSGVSSVSRGNEIIELPSVEIYQLVSTRGIARKPEELPAINLGIKLTVALPEEIRKLGNTSLCTGTPRFGEEFEKWSLELLGSLALQVEKAVPSAPEIFGYVEALPGHREALFHIMM